MPAIVRTAAFATVVFGLSFASAQADVVVPNRKYVSHQVRFDGLRPLAKQYRFYVVGKASNEESVNIPVPSKGQIDYRIYFRYLARGPYLYAVPASLPLGANNAPSSAWFSDKTPGVLRSDELVKPVRDTQAADPHDTYQTVYKVTLKETPAKSGSPRRELVVTRMSDGWKEPTRGAGRGLFLLGVPTLAAFALAGRLRPRRSV